MVLQGGHLSAAAIDMGKYGWRAMPANSRLTLLLSLCHA